VLDAIERWRPTGVFGFAVTWAELARFDLGQRDLSSVSNWFNTGDCAHETHIRRLVAVGSHPVRGQAGAVVEVPGSKFIDGIGSTEMGHSAFRIAHHKGSNRYGRCVGKPYPFADVALLDLTTGEPISDDGAVGHVALKSPTLALGYWNDSAATFRTRFGGYYLTGDLMYRDGDGYYYEAATHEAAIREALGGPAAATLRQIMVAGEEDLVIGPTGKVRKFLMRQRHLAATGT
jgi:acyl-coenzyme A synthetase/AMP-(fatty) acid ligase